MPVTVSGKTFQRRRNWTALRQKMPMAEAELMALYESMGFKPFDLQKEILLDRHRYKCLAIGLSGSSLFRRSRMVCSPYL